MSDDDYAWQNATLGRLFPSNPCALKAAGVCAAFLSGVD
jgi:hypothetical protein